MAVYVMNWLQNATSRWYLVKSLAGSLSLSNVLDRVTDVTPTSVSVNVARKLASLQSRYGLVRRNPVAVFAKNAFANRGSSTFQDKDLDD